MIIDRFSKMCVLIPYKKTINEKEVAKNLFRQVWVHFGMKIIQIISLYCFPSEWKQVEESVHGTIFTGGTQCAKLGFETFRENFEESNDVFRNYFFLI